MGAVILIIDDDKDITNLLRIYLEMEHYEVRFAHDGEEGLKILSKLPADFIILDVIMPKKDGILVFREIRQGNQTNVRCKSRGYGQDLRSCDGC